MAGDDEGDLPAPPPARRRRRWPIVVIVSVVVIAGLGLVVSQAVRDEGPLARGFGARPPASVVLDLVDTTGEQGTVEGMFGIAVAKGGHQILLIRNTTDGNLELAAYDYAVGKPIDPSTGHVIISVPHPYVHNGGGLAVLPSGDVLVSLMADIPSLGPPPAPLQRPDGVIVRVPERYISDSDAGPFTPGPSDLIARGLRNPYRISYDDATGDVWIGDNGEELVEEVDRIPAKDLGRKVLNFGWPYLEASKVNLPVPPGVTFTPPVYEYEHSDGHCSIISGSIYHGTKLAGLDGALLFADFCGPNLSALLHPGTPKQRAIKLAELPEAGPIALAQAENGEVYLTSTTNVVVRLESERGGSKPSVSGTIIARPWGPNPPGNPPGMGHELAGITLGPDQSELLIAERSGYVARVELNASGDAVNPSGKHLGDHPTVHDRPVTSGTICQTERDLRISDYDKESPADMKRDLTSASDHLDAITPLLPDRLVPPAEIVRHALDDLLAQAKASGWDGTDPDLLEVARSIQDERGEHAKAYYALQLVQSYTNACPQN